MATAGADGKVKVWDCRNWKGCVREWKVRSMGGGGPGVGIELEWSQKGLLGVASGGSVMVYRAPTTPSEQPSRQPTVYLTHSIPHRPLTSLRFCPFTDVLTIGHSKGLSSILVPGAGEPHFDSREADPFEIKSARREKEVHALLDKIPADLITLSDEFAGTLAPQKSDFDASRYEGRAVPVFSNLGRLDRLRATGKVDKLEMQDPADETESGSDAGDKEDDSDGDNLRRTDNEKNKMGLKGSGLKRHHQKKAVKDEVKLIALRKKILPQQQPREAEQGGRTEANSDSGKLPPLTGALARFVR